MSASFEREDTLKSHRRLHRLQPHSSSMQHLMYPSLPEYNNLNNPPSPPAYQPNPPISPNQPSSSTPFANANSLEKYSNILIGELKKKPQKEKALKDALELQDKVNQCEQQLQQAEVEAVRKRQQLEEQIEELERKKEEMRKHLEMVAVELEHSREATRISIKSIQSHSDFKDRNGIERLSREIDQLNYHASKVQTVFKMSSGDLASTSTDDNSLLCPVCLSVPDEQIYTCLNCDNMVCGSCRAHVNSCPTCRKNFKSSPPKRNRLAERLIACRR